MGTRSLTYVQDADGDNLICIYQQYDGYFTGVGSEILDFISGSQIVNGIGYDKNYKQFNGPGDLAARLITMMKDGDDSHVGNVYVQPADTPEDSMGAEYVYKIKCEVGQEPHLTAVDLYRGYEVSAYVSQFRFPEIDSDGEYVDIYDLPVTEAQRGALFALFMKVTGSVSPNDRHAFTRSVLGPDAPQSWSAKDGINFGQAKRLLAVLDTLANIS